MVKSITSLECRLKECKNIRECFTIQNALADGLTAEQELELRARYAGLTLEEAKVYQEALRIVRTTEAKPVVKRQLSEVNRIICNVALN